jgi:hypothetical protein
LFRGVDIANKAASGSTSTPALPPRLLRATRKAAAMLMQAHLARLKDDVRASLKVRIGELDIG